ncbi:MAG: RNA polymerase sigma factor [Acidobacteriota bacterium]
MVDDESSIIRKCQKGATEPFKVLVDRYKEKAYFFALSIVGNCEDAHDLSQEAFIKAYRSLKYFKIDYKFSSWFFRILRNLCIDFLRQKKRKKENSTEGYGERPTREIVDMTYSPDSFMQRDELRMLIWEEIQKLREEEREIMICKDIHGMSYEDIAAVMEIPKGTVASTLHKARKKLKERLARHL